MAKKTVAPESASALISERIKELADWRGKMLATLRAIVHKADPEIVEEWKWRGTVPGPSDVGLVRPERGCTSGRQTIESRSCARSQLPV